MSYIKILPDRLANMIAAGEVVERPASVVKELVENSIDAESTMIQIELEQGGTRLIQISDNGKGMSSEDALLSLKRHATSKIASEDDLFRIQTMGFRGEALPSISSICHMTMITRQKENDIGTQLQIIGSKIVSQIDVGAPVGTLIKITDLFYNTPARKKFMKSSRTEMAQIMDKINGIAMAWPHIHFRIVHNSKEFKNWPNVNNLPDRIADILGRDIFQYLKPIQYEADFLRLTGWAALPDIRKKAYQGFVYVNGRLIKDKIIRHALNQAYEGKLMKDEYPVAVLFLNVPCDQVDVNVHPSKLEVRFAKQQSIHDAVVIALKKTLESHKGSHFQIHQSSYGNNDERYHQNQIHEEIKLPFQNQSIKPITHAQHPKSVLSSKRLFDHNLYPNRQSHQIQNRMPVPDDLANQTITPQNQRSVSIDAINQTVPPQNQRPVPIETVDQAIISETKSDNRIEESKIQITSYRDLRVIGQLRETYIICESSDGLILIDQHAAHERVIYEQIKESIEANDLPVQRLLIPEIIELNHSQFALFEEIQHACKLMGIDIEIFGNQTIAIKAVPDILSKNELKPMLIELIQAIEQIGCLPDKDKIFDERLKLMACHAAIRAGQQLKMHEMVQLLHQLDQCHYPSQCPHGRPILIIWYWHDIEKKCRRIIS